MSAFAKDAEMYLFKELAAEPGQTAVEIVMFIIKMHDAEIAYHCGVVTERATGKNELTRTVWVRTLFIPNAYRLDGNGA